MKFLKIKNGKLLKKKINRRNFLKKTALISSAVTLSTLIKKPNGLFFFFSKLKNKISNSQQIDKKKNLKQWENTN